MGGGGNFCVQGEARVPRQPVVPGRRRQCRRQRLQRERLAPLSRYWLLAAAGARAHQRRD